MSDHLVEKTDAFGDVAVHVMPERYAGAALRATLPPESRMAQPRPLAPAMPPAGPTPPKTTPPPLNSRTQHPATSLWVGGGVVVVLLLVIIGFLLYPKSPNTPSSVHTPVVITPTPAVTTTAEVTTTVSTTSTLAFTGSFRNAMDTDLDGVTDVEETEIYQTNPNNVDTDRDSYLDGGEVFFLYNPNGFAPITLIGSGVVHVIGSASLGFSAYAPTAWAVQTDAQSLIVRSPGDEEKFRYEVRLNPGNLPLKDWIGAQDMVTDPSTLIPLTNRMGMNGYRSADTFIAYYAMEGAVLVITYDPGARRELQYRRTFDMTINSVALSKVPLTPQEIVALVPGAASGTQIATSSLGSTSTVDATSTGMSTSTLVVSTTAKTTTTVSTSSTTP